MKIKQIFKYLDEHKDMFGLSDWTMILKKDSLEDGNNNMAEVDVDIYEKEMNITLSKDFFKLSKSKQENILLHELLHGRLNIYQLCVGNMTKFMEEDLVNDIIRGVVKHVNKTNNR